MTSFCIKETNDNCAEEKNLSVMPLMLSFPWIGKKNSKHMNGKSWTHRQIIHPILISWIIYNIVLRRMPWLSEWDAINVIVIIRMWTFLKVDLPDVTNVLHLQCRNWNLIALMLRALQFSVSFFFCCTFHCWLACMWHRELARRCANKLNSLNKRIAENVKIWSINGEVTHKKKHRHNFCVWVRCVLSPVQ